VGASSGALAAAEGSGSWERVEYPWFEFGVERGIEHLRRENFE